MPIRFLNTTGGGGGGGGVSTNLIPQVSGNSLTSTFTDPLSEFVVSASARIDVDLPSGTSNGDYLRWNATTNVWEPQAEPVLTVYRNERFFFTHYRMPPLQFDISNATFFNLLDQTDVRRGEFSRDGGPPGLGTDWTIDPVTNTIIWQGSETIPVMVEASCELERVQRRRCVCMLFPTYNGSDTDDKIFGNGAIAKLSRNSSTSLACSFYMDLAPNDGIQLLVRKVGFDATTTSRIKTRKVSIKIYTLKTEDLPFTEIIDASPPASPTRLLVG